MSIILSKLNPFISKFERIKDKNNFVKSETEKLSEIIFDKYGFKNIEPPNYDQIKKKVISALNEDTKIEIKEVKYVTKEIFLDTFTDFLKNKLLKIFEEYNESKLWKNLLLNYLMYFDEENEFIKKSSKLLIKNKESLPNRWLKRIEYLDLLDCKKIANDLGDKILNEKQISSVLIKAGLTAGLSSSRVVKDSIYQIAHEVENSNNEDKVSDFAKIVQENNKIKDNLGPQALLGLLGGFVNKQPSASLKILLQNLFMESYSDPRINPERWPSILSEHGGQRKRNQCIGVLKKWIMLQNIEIFFQIMGETAIEHQFKEREKLWKKYFKQNLITDTCLILGWDLLPIAKNRRENDEECKHLQWARLENAGKNQSVLLMEINSDYGKVSIAEWSHNGAFIIWSEDKKSPNLHRSLYTGTQLRNDSSDKVNHQGKRWVMKIENCIEKYTGHRLD